MRLLCLECHSGLESLLISSRYNIAYLRQLTEFVPKFDQQILLCLHSGRDNLFGMAKNPKFRSNTKWSLEDEDRLAAMISSGMSVIAMATEMQRSYRAIEDRIGKIKRSEAK